MNSPVVSLNTDRKERFAGLLENPYVSMIQRDILDNGRLQGLSGLLRELNPSSVLDVGCGLGENSRLFPGHYLGLDNSFPRIAFASGRYQQARFVLADALRMPVRPGTFDLVMLIDTSHHLSDEQFMAVLQTMRTASRRWVVVSDPLLFEGQSALSRFFYSLDRGARFRSEAELKAVLARCSGLRLEKFGVFHTFPGLYCHGVFVLDVAPVNRRV